MTKKIKQFAFIVVMVYLLYPISVYANTNQPEVLVLYSLESEDQLKEVRILDTLVGEFTDQSTIVKEEDFNPKDIGKYTHVIYYGGVEKKLSQELVQAIKRYQKPLYFMGHNAEQLGERFSFLAIHEEVLITKVEATKTNKVYPLESKRTVFDITIEPETSILLKGYKESGNSIPILVENNKDFYFSGQTFYNPFGKEVAESLTHFFDSTKKENIRYLRLEDIHPKTNANQLQEQAEYLKEKDIPYMVSVIPVHFSKGKATHLSDSPQLVKTLRYMQDNKGSIVMHGYKHQYRHNETGEGFEFWDVDNNRPIYQHQDEEIKEEKDFSSKEEFDAYIVKGEKFEKNYIENALTKGIQELTAHKLYPLAFEAPHYAISQNGYKILSNHFSTYSGELQLTDSDWESTYAPPFKSKPSFLHGMTLYPETLGYTQEGNDEAVQLMKDEINSNKGMTKAYFSAFYHPYLGLEGLKETVESLEAIEEAIWLDLKTEENRVHIDTIHIESKNGEISVDKPFISSKYEKKLRIKKAIQFLIPIGLFFGIIITYTIINHRLKNEETE